MIPKTIHTSYVYDPTMPDKIIKSIFIDKFGETKNN